MTLLTNLPRPLLVLEVPIRFADEQRLLALTYPDVADVVLDLNVLRPIEFITTSTAVSTRQCAPQGNR